MKGNDLLMMGVLGFLGYVMYEHYGAGVAWTSLPGGPVFTSLGLKGLGCGCDDRPKGVGYIAENVHAVYGGFRPNIMGAGLAGRNEVLFAQRS